MLRAHWTVDLLEAHLVENLLREHGIAAWVFDADFVRQDWLKSIAMGGYRVMVAHQDAAEAAAILAAWRRGDFALEKARGDSPCPRCGEEGETDPGPRRLVFLVLIAIGVADTLVFLAAPGYADIEALASFLAQGFAVPLVALHVLKRRAFRCGRCRTRWSVAAAPYRELAARAESL